MRIEEERELMAALPDRVAAFDEGGIQFVADSQDPDTQTSMLQLLSAGTAVQISRAVSKVFVLTEHQSANLSPVTQAVLAQVQQAANQALQGASPLTQGVIQSLSWIWSGLPR
jgi:hypothetical protein